MCEKQILVPNNSILYCSERYLIILNPPTPLASMPSHSADTTSPSCRRRDGSKGPSADTYLAAYTSTFPSHSPTAETIDVFGQTTRCLTSRRKITSPTTSSSIPPELHNAKADLDPTEWKPDIETRASSEAFEYLAQFHRSTPSPVPRRPGLHGRSTTSILMARTAPSLSHTPTTSTSSEESEAGTPYDFVANMGQAKQHEPVVEIKSVEMGKQSLGAMSVEGKPVRKNPTASPMLGDLSYEKQLVDGSMQRLDGSLKKLLHLREVEGE